MKQTVKLGLLDLAFEKLTDLLWVIAFVGVIWYMSAKNQWGLALAFTFFIGLISTFGFRMILYFLGRGTSVILHFWTNVMGLIATSVVSFIFVLRPLENIDIIPFISVIIGYALMTFLYYKNLKKRYEKKSFILFVPEKRSSGKK